MLFSPVLWIGGAVHPRLKESTGSLDPMMMVKLRKMSQDEFDEWRPRAVADYAADHVRAGSMPSDQAEELAEKQFRGLLPDGVATPEQHLLIPVLDGTPIGFLWLQIPSSVDAPEVFIYDISVDPSMRGRGLGRAVMVAGEDYARQRGAQSIRLHVFGENSVARGLYEDLGYDVTNVMMAKTLA